MNIIFVGLQGVPYLGRACDPRLANTANLLAEKSDVTILNRYSSLNRRTMDGILLDERIQLVEIISRRNTGGLLTAFLSVLSILFEPFCLFRIHRKNPIDYLHIYSGHYFDFVLYRIFAKLIGAKVIYEYVEYRSEKNKNPNLYHRINNWLCDKKGAKLWDSCIAISNFLEQKAKEVNPSLPVIKVTPLCDFNLFDRNHSKIDVDDPYLMFCGSAEYFEVVKFIIDSYRISCISKTKKLLLVLGGTDPQIRRVKDYDQNCLIRCHIPYDELIAYYKHAFALLIPLRDTIEDIARFPNKICEYTAARGLIVTTNNGEIPYYFKHAENAIVADECTVEKIAECLDEIENGRYDIETIKQNCYQTGLDNFSISAYEEKLPSFLCENR